MAARRVAKVGVDVGFKMGDGVGAFWRHAINTEPIVVYSVALSAIGIFHVCACKQSRNDNGMFVRSHNCICRSQDLST